MQCLRHERLRSDLDELLISIASQSSVVSQGADIDAANVELLDPVMDAGSKIARFRAWASRYQPCMFGRLGARGLRGIRYEFCWIERADMQLGSAHVREKIQQARRSWKERAAEGQSHGFLIMFNAPELAYAPPGAKLLEICLTLCDLYLPEHAPVRPDTIYNESLPFNEADGTITCLKGGINVFYGSAHRTSNHDRRIPGGIMISVNSPGLFAHSLVKRGIAADLPGALDAVRNLAWASIGNGGQSRGKSSEHSCSWHNNDVSRPATGCPMKHRPPHVPEGFDTNFYSAMYHTDVLIPSRVMLDAIQDKVRGESPVWPNLDFEYLLPGRPELEHENFGFVHGAPVSSETQHQFKWAPRAASYVTAKEYQP